jgi:PadR family transcriptional regulator, regulatory protein PadR
LHYKVPKKYLYICLVNEQNYIDNLNAQFRKGMLEYLIFILIEKNEAYAPDLIRILREKDLLVVEGTLYPLLTRMKKAGLLTYRWEESPSGPPRKYYSLSVKGKNILPQMHLAWQKWQQTVEELKTT